MQFSLLLDVAEVRESVAGVVRDLRGTGPCQGCGLSLLNPTNQGVMYRGDPNARIAVLDIAPGAAESKAGQPLAGKSGAEFEKWMRYLNLDTKNELFITQIVQCQPPSSRNKEGWMEQRAPLQKEVAACWYPRSLRMLAAMPHLECVITLGFDAAKAMLGGDPGPRSHEGRWFVSSLLPGIPVFCLDHPEATLVNPTPAKKGQTKATLDCFRREYSLTRKVVSIAAGSHP